MVFTVTLRSSQKDSNQNIWFSSSVESIVQSGPIGCSSGLSNDKTFQTRPQRICHHLDRQIRLAHTLYRQLNRKTTGKDRRLRFPTHFSEVGDGFVAVV